MGVMNTQLNLYTLKRICKYLVERACSKIKSLVIESSTRFNGISPIANPNLSTKILKMWVKEKTWRLKFGHKL